MSQLRSDILKKRKREEIEKAEQQYKRIHIATPIQPYASDEEDQDDFSQINISDNEEDEETIIDDNLEGDLNIDNTNEILSIDYS